MSIAVIIQLLETFGPSGVQLVTFLINKWETNGAVTSAEWAAVTASAALTAKDQMTSMLTKAGIDPASPQGVALLALVK